MRTLIIALILAPLWISPALAQEARTPSRTDPAVERQPRMEVLEQRLSQLERTWEQGYMEVHVSLEERVQNLADRLSALEQRISAVEQAAAAPRLQALEAATEELSEQLSSLLGVIEVTGGGVQISTAGKLDFQASSVEVVAAKATLNAALVEASGILKAHTVQAETVDAKTYTPGAGNIW